MIPVTDELTTAVAALIDRMATPVEGARPANWHIRFFETTPLSLIAQDVADVAEESLPWLARQFGMYGTPLWQLAITEKQKRDVLRSAVEIYRYSGTAHGIRLAIQALGYDDVTVDEDRATVLHDGSIGHDGTHYHSGDDRFCFRVVIAPGEQEAITDDLPLIKQMIEEFKNVRSRCISVTFE